MMLPEQHALPRCPACRYSFEPSETEATDRCPQCGGPLTDDDAEPDREFATDQSLTHKMKTIPKPDE